MILYPIIIIIVGLHNILLFTLKFPQNGTNAINNVFNLIVKHWICSCYITQGHHCVIEVKQEKKPWYKHLQPQAKILFHLVWNSGEGHCVTTRHRMCWNWWFVFFVNTQPCHTHLLIRYTVFSEVTVCLCQNEYLYHVWRNSLVLLLRYYVHKVKMFCEVTMPLTFKLS